MINSVSLLPLFKIVHNFFYHLCKFIWYLFIIFAYNFKLKTIKMTNKEKLELKKLLYEIMVIGDNNSMVRKHFDVTEKKEWIKFIDKYLKTLEI